MSVNSAATRKRGTGDGDIEFIFDRYLLFPMGKLPQLWMLQLTKLIKRLQIVTVNSVQDW